MTHARTAPWLAHAELAHDANTVQSTTESTPRNTARTRSRRRRTYLANPDDVVCCRCAGACLLFLLPDRALLLFCSQELSSSSLSSSSSAASPPPSSPLSWSSCSSSLRKNAAGMRGAAATVATAATVGVRYDGWLLPSAASLDAPPPPLPLLPPARLGESFRRWRCCDEDAIARVDDARSDRGGASRARPPPPSPDAEELMLPASALSNGLYALARRVGKPGAGPPAGGAADGLRAEAPASPRLGASYRCCSCCCCCH